MNKLSSIGRTLASVAKFSGVQLVPKRCLTSSLDIEKRRLVVDPEDGSSPKDEYPWIWLRDNCQCSSCYESQAQSRIINLSEYDLNIKPTSTQANEEKISVSWEDGHVSTYGYKWLLERSFRPEQRQKFRRSFESEQSLWEADFQEKIPRADFNQIMKDDKALLSWLENLDRYGFVLVENVPVKTGPVPELQKRAGFERLTHYGPGYNVQVRPNPSNVSYTHHRIFFHTDLTYYDHMPGTIFLHCIEQHQGKGGETMLADGFKAAKYIKENHPDKYEILSSVVTYFKDIGSDYIKFNKFSYHPVFVHNFRGELVRINWSHFARDSFFDVDADKVEKVYESMRLFDDTLNNPDFHIRLKMQPGDMVTVKNQRILHGRSELEGGISGRHLQCGYMDWDEIKSTIRVIRANLDKQ